MAESTDASRWRLRWLRPVPSRPRRRPADLTYAADERPPLGPLGVLAAQHAAMALALTSYAILAAHQGGLDADATRDFVAMTILAMAVGTALQARGGIVGAGALIIHMPDPFFIGIAATALKAAGPAGLAAISLTSGVVQLAVARVIGRLRGLFPPPVTGVVVLVAGLSLVEYAFSNALGVADRQRVEGGSVLVFAATLGVMAGLSIWGSRGFKLFALLGGLGAGITVAAATGDLAGGGAVAAAPMFDWPSWTIPRFEGVQLGSLLPVAFIGVFVCLDTLANVVILDRMDDAGWRRADMRMVAGGITANGIGDVTSGLLGGMPVAPSTANIGLAHASRATSRLVGAAAAALLALVAMSPKMVVALTMLPTPVMGAIGLYAAAFLITAGIELVASRALDTRAVFMVGISVSLAMVALAYDYLVETAPAAIQALFDDAIVLAGVTAIVLNLVFRIGTVRHDRIEAANGDLDAEAIVGFVEAAAARWGARLDVTRRAAGAAVVAAEEIEATGRRLVAVSARFDEMNLDVVLHHSGAALDLAVPAKEPAPELLDGDATLLDVAVAAARRRVVARLADRAEATSAGADARLLLHFDH